MWKVGCFAYSGSGTYTITVALYGGIECHLHLESIEDTGTTSNLGAIKCNSIDYILPDDVIKPAGTYDMEYISEEGYIFDHWETTGGVSVSVATDNPAAVTVSVDGTLKAVYRVLFTVHLESVEDTGATTNLGAIAFDGMSYSLPKDVSKLAGTYTAEYFAEPGYNFDHWETLGGASVSVATDNPTTVTVSGDGTLSAVFVEKPECTVTFLTDPVGPGFNITFLGVTCLDGDTGTFAYGTSDLVAANCPEGYVFDHWEVAGNVEVSSASDPSTTLTITCGGTLKAVFVEKPEGPIIYIFEDTVSEKEDSAQHQFVVPSGAVKVEVLLEMPVGADFDLSLWDDLDRRTGG